jgi:pseudaminic acid cytidylyltransferase
MNCLAVIPARGGSKRLPRKNIIDFLGRPIISYTIEAALNSNCFSRIIISTDDVEIAEISSRYHVDILMRPPWLSTDDSTVAEVCEHILLQEGASGFKYDVISVLYATAPLRNAADICEVMSYIISGNHRSAMAVTNYSHPVHQALIKSKVGVKPAFPALYSKRTSEVQEYYVDNGSTYAVATDFFLKYKKFISKDLAVHIMPKTRSVDIDNWDDYFMARFFAEFPK